MRFVNPNADLAEAEGHHPDIGLHDLLDLTLSTHAIGGMSENDFIMASKIDRLSPLPPEGWCGNPRTDGRDCVAGPEAGE